MTLDHREQWSSATRTVASRLRELTKKRGWTAALLADHCASLGMKHLNRSVIANIESGRRTYVTVDELLTLAYALDVAPIHLLVPTEVNDQADAHRYQVTPDVFMKIPATRQWIRGKYCPPGRDPRIYFAEVPRDEWEAPESTPEKIQQEGARIEQHRDLSEQLGVRPSSRRKKADDGR